MLHAFKLKWGCLLLSVVFPKCFSDKITFQISHCNDLSAQLETFVKEPSYSTKAPKSCTQNCTEDGCPKCVGGLTNFVNHLHSIDDKHKGKITEENHFILSAGNLIGGESGWVPIMQSGWTAFGNLITDYIKPTAAALGMKEFGAGLKETINLLKNVTDSRTKISLVNSCDAKYEGSEKAFCEMIAISPAVTRLILKDSIGANYSVGIIGFTNTLAERLSLPGALKFTDIVTSIKNTVSNAAVSDIKTFIAIGDGSLSIAQSIIDAVPKVKMVLYSSGFSSPTDMPGSYPLRHKHGYIATAGKYGSTVGKLVLTVDTNNGNLDLVNGELRATTYKPDPVNANLNIWKDALFSALKDTKAYTHVKLTGGEPCWRKECNLGNLMTDAVVHCILMQVGDSSKLKEPLHAVWHGGAFFEDTVRAGRDITTFDIHKWLPYPNNVHLVAVTGTNLRKLFDVSATGLNPQAANRSDWRYFLQVSNGFEVYYDTESEKVPKVTRIRMNHDLDGVPGIKDIEETNEKIYFLVIPTYLYEMRGYYKFGNDFWKQISWGNASSSNAGIDDECLGNYVNAMGVVTVGSEARIFINDPNGGGGGDDIPDPPYQRKLIVTVILTIVFYSIFLVVAYIGYFYVIPRLRRPSNRYPLHSN